MAFFDFIGVLIGILFLHGTVHAPAPAEAPLIPPPSISQTNSANQGNVEKLAKCLTQKRVTMYGAYWCPHCANQKKEFGSAFQYITYQECDDKGPGGDSKLCKKVGINGYPTWIKADKQKAEGELSLEALATFANCPYVVSK